jgi:hypothetical protein
MGLSRTEIEILLKARAEGAAAFDQFGTQLGKVRDRTKESGEQQKNHEESTRRNQTQMLAAGAAAGLLAERIGSALVGAFRSSIDAANRMDAALAGLSAVASGMKVDVDSAKAAAQDLASNGLMTVGEAATGLKNLLASGFGLPEAIQLMKVAGDSAAFNRQGMLAYGEAVVRFTEGIKFGNSALTDSTGLGKNLSAIMRDAGLSIDAAGRAAQDAGVRQAILNGFMKEGVHYIGDAEKYANSAAGAQARWAQQTEYTAAAFGKALQPALKMAIDLGTPLLGVLEKLAPVLAPLAGIIAGLVGPMVAWRAATMLGIVELFKFKGGLELLAKVAKVNIFANLMSGLSAIPGLALGASNALKALALAAATNPYVAIGTALVALTYGITGLIEKSQNAKLAAETHAAQEDVRRRAIEKGAAANISYAKAVDFLIAKEQERKALASSGLAADMARIDAQIRLAKMGKDIDLDLLNRLTREKEALELQARRISLTKALEGSEQTFQAELKKTGLTVRELSAALEKDEAAVKKWAEANGISEESLNRLKDGLQKKKQADNEARQAAQQHQQQIEQQRSALEQLGIVTRDHVNKQLAEYAALEARAVAEGVPLSNVLAALAPKYFELYEAARKSGVGVEEATAALARARAEALKGIDIHFDTRGLSELGGYYGELTDELRKLTPEAEHAALEAKELEEAYKRVGITTRDELLKTARQAEIDYARIAAAVGTHAPEAVEAFRRMVEAQIAAGTRVPTFWETQVVPRVINAGDRMMDGITNGLSRMLTGAESFKSGFIGIFNEIKRSVLDTFREILHAFLDGLIKGMIGGLMGANLQGGFGNWLGGLFSGRGGGGPGGPFSTPPFVGGGIGGWIPGQGGGGFPMDMMFRRLPGLGGLFGGGGATTIIPGTGIPTVAGAGGTGLVAPPGMAGAGGGGLGFLSNPAFWTNPWTIAGLGGIALGTWAWKKGWGRGGEEALKVNPARDEFLSRFSDLDPYRDTNNPAGFYGLAARLTEITGEEGGGELFRALNRADTMKEFEAAIFNIEKALADHSKGATPAAEDAAKATEDLAGKTTASKDAIAALTESLTAMTAGVSDLTTSLGELANQIRAALDAITAPRLELPPGTIPINPIPDGETTPLAETPADFDPERGYARGIFSTKPVVGMFAEKEPELGGPVSFMRKVLAGALHDSGPGLLAGLFGKAGGSIVGAAGGWLGGIFGGGDTRGNAAEDFARVIRDQLGGGAPSSKDVLWKDTMSKSAEAMAAVIDQFIGRERIEADYAREREAGYTGTREQFVAEQAHLYETADEDDPRLRTTFLMEDLKAWQRFIQEGGELLRQVIERTRGELPRGPAGDITLPGTFPGKDATGMPLVGDMPSLADHIKGAISAALASARPHQLNLTFNISALTAADFQQAIVRDVVPILEKVWDHNQGGHRTETQFSLGIR